jgi:uncharacterized protein YcfJ
MRCSRQSAVLFLLFVPTLFGGPLFAQETVIQVENVRIDYAQVLRVDPVYQTLTATQIEQQCEGKPAPETTPPKGLSRIVGKVKHALGSDEAAAAVPDENCRMVPVKRQFRRPIAYDVDYIYKGMKYRSRLPGDPGNRLRVRVSVTPYVVPDKH